MTNTINFNNKNFQAAAVAVKNDILASGATGNTMEDAYKTVCKYVNVTKEQFNELYKQASKKIAYWKNGGCELDDEDLDMVVGGSFVSDFLNNMAKDMVETALTVSNFVSDHASEIALVAGAALIFSGIGAFAGASMMACATTGAIGGAVVGAVAGGTLGAAIIYQSANQE